MNISNIAKSCSPKRVLRAVEKRINAMPEKRTNDVLVWLAPTAVIPIARQKLDSNRKDGAGIELFYRDFIAYASGAASYFIGQKSAESFLNKTEIEPFKSLSGKRKRLAATTVGVGIYLHMATFGAVKLAKKLIKIEPEHENNLHNFPLAARSLSNAREVDFKGYDIKKDFVNPFIEMETQLKKHHNAYDKK